MQSDKSCEVPKLNFSSLMLWIWVGVCTPDNGPHMFTDPVEELKLDPLTDLDLLHTLRQIMHYETGLIVHVQTASNLKEIAGKNKNTDQLSQHTLEQTTTIGNKCSIV